MTNKMTTLFTNNETVILNDTHQAIKHAMRLKTLYMDMKRTLKNPNHITYQELHECWEYSYNLYHSFNMPINFERAIRSMGLGKKYQNVIGCIERIGYRKCFNMKNHPMGGENSLTTKDAKGGLQHINSSIIAHYEEEGKTSPLFYRIDNYRIQSYVQIPLFKVVAVKTIPVYNAYGQETSCSRAYIVGLNEEIKEYFAYYENLAKDFEENKGRNKAKSALKSFLRTCKVNDVDYEEILNSMDLKDLYESLHIADRGRE